MVTTSLPVHHVQCAALASCGCESTFTWESPSTEPIDAIGERRLALNGWRLDHGQWVCGSHGAPEVPEPQTIDYTRRHIGHDLTFRPVDGGRQLDATGWGPSSGRRLREGDYLVLANGARTTRYRVASVSYFADPPDMWHAILAFAPRQAPDQAQLPAATA